jgi:hypothetical protein
MTLDHLDEIADTLCDVHAGIAKRIDVAGRTSAEWGQPWLSAYLRWKRHARQRASRPRDALVVAGLPTEPEHPTEGLPNAHHA